MNAETLMQWFTKEILPSVIKNGKFAEADEQQTLEKCEFEAIEKYISSFASAPCFAKLTLKTASGTVTRHILVKFQIQDPLFREKMRTVQQYKNEVTLYNEVYPRFVEFLQSSGQTSDFIEKVVPKCYFASDGGENPEKALLILEDLRQHGFRLSNSASELDLKHCFTAVEKLARFHAVSFAMKFKGWKPFDKIKTSFGEVWLGDDPVCKESCEMFHGRVSQRGINYLLSQPNCEVPKEYLEKLKRILEPIFELLQSLKLPREPLSVVCHGDFNRNNILFKYAGKEMVDAKVIDYQTTCYGSPMLDLGFLIYMNTTLATREKHFDDIFEQYYSNLVKHISTILNEEEKSIADRIPIEAFKEDFERVAIFHYVIISFFLPFMMVTSDSDFESDLKNQNFAEMAEQNCKKGGEFVSKRISDVIVDFYRRKFYM